MFNFRRYFDMKNILMRLFAMFIIGGLIFGQTVYAAPPKALSDIKGHWAESNIQALFAKGIITGNDKGKYEPNKAITRAEFTALLVRAMGLKTAEGNSFFDLNYSKFWAKPYIETAVANGIIIPSEVGTEFNGNVPLKRLDMAVMMARALKVEQSTGENPFYDVQESNGYLTKLYEEYLMRGYNEGGKTLFKQNSQTVKAEAATVVARILEYKVNPTAYIEKVGREDRLKNMNPTEDDIKAKLAEELKKQAASSTYIMEPVLTFEYSESQAVYFNLWLENMTDYANDCEYKVECLNYPLLNSFDQPSTGTGYWRTYYDKFKPLGIQNLSFPRMKIFTLGRVYYTTREHIDTFKLTPGMEIKLKITFKRSSNTRTVYKTVKAPMFKPES